MATQTCINKRTGRKCRNFDEAEREYQEAQSAWELNQNDKKAWDTMFLLINAAVFNSLNKDLEFKLPKDEIEGRSLDITMNIMRALLNKRKKGLPWKIGKVSSAIHLPCMAKYDMKLQFADKCLSESSFIQSDITAEETVYIFDDPDYQYALGYGFTCRVGIPNDWLITNEEENDKD